MDAVARMYAEADGQTRVALIARRGAEIAGVAGYDLLRDLGAAEVSFVIEAAFEQRGLGTRMLEELAEHAAQRGLVRLQAEAPASNDRILRIFRDAGFAVRSEHAADEVTLVREIRPSERLAERVAGSEHADGAAVASLRALLAPRSVAVVGASEDPASVGGRVLRSIIAGGFCGAAWPVNRSAGIVCSARAVPALSDLPQAPDLALIVVPAAEVAGVVEEAGRIGVRAVLVMSAGFAEAGGPGVKLEAELLEIVRAHGMRMVGPNSLGVANEAQDVRLHATGGAARALPGSVAIVSESGAFGVALLGLAQARGLGVASFLALGNRADVSTNDLLEYWEDEDAVAAIVLYLESFGNPQRFASIARRVSRHKPILVVKGRRTPRWRAPARRSYTAGALRSEDGFKALFRDSGVLRLDSSEELFDLAELLERQPLPAGRSVGVVTNSGGLATLATDASLSGGLSLPELSQATQAKLARALPRAPNLSNPVDLTVGAHAVDFATAVRELLREPTVDAVVVLFIALADVDAVLVIDAVERAAAGAYKPVVASILGPDGQPPHRVAGRVPNYRMPEAGVAALARAADRHAWLSRPLGQPARLPGVQPERAREVVLAALDGESDRVGGGWMDATSIDALLNAYGIALAPSARCQNPQSTVAAAERFGGPVALKASLPPPNHAGDIDAVLLGVTGEDAIRAGWEELRHRVRAAAHPWTDEVVVQPMIDPGADVLVGSVNDPDLGPLVGLGVGRPRPAMPHVITFRLAPTTDTDVEELIAASTGVNAWLNGSSGGPRLDRLALRDLLLRFARLLTDTPELAEGDLDPVRVLPAGCFVMDAHLRVATPAPHDRTW